MIDYVALQGVASDLLEDAGELVTVTFKTAGTYDPATSTSAPTSTDVEVHAVFVRMNQQDRRSFQSSHPDVENGEDKVILSAAECGQQPRTGDLVTRGSTVYRFYAGDAINPGGTPLVYFGYLVR